MSLLAIITISLLGAGVAHAADLNAAAPAAAPTTGVIKLANPLGAGATIPGILKRIFNQVAIILAFVIPIIIIIGAFQMMFAQGNPEKFAEGQKTITYAIIGYVIILMANGIIAIVQRILTPSSQ
jgi:hypothetical protein